MTESVEAGTHGAERGSRIVAVRRDSAVAEMVVYSVALAGIYVLQGSLWFFSFKSKLFEDGTNAPPSIEQQFAGTIVDRTIGTHAAWVVLGVLELLVFAAVAISVVAGEFLPKRPKHWLLGALAGGMLTFGVLLFGTTLTSDSTGSAQLYAYFAGTAVLMLFVLLMPPHGPRSWQSIVDARDDL